MAARAFGARDTYFSVNGSTVGIHAMVHAAVKPGGKILINRDAHTSVINAISLLKAEPVCIIPRYDEDIHLTLGCEKSDLESALLLHRDVQAVLLTRPNYYGVARDIKGMAKAARARGIPFLVDEAHGAHFAFSGLFPPPALGLGADACVQSMHKTLPALTQTALSMKARHPWITEAFQAISMFRPQALLCAYGIPYCRKIMEKRE